MKNILVIDDDIRVKYLFTETLEKSFKLDFAGTIESAKKKLLRNQFDLIFLDIKLPDGDGIDLLETLIKTHRVPVCMISAYGTTDLIVKAIKLGAYDFLEKPLNKEKIKIITANILNRVEKEKTIERLTDEIKKEIPFVGQSKVYRELVQKIEKFAQSSAPLLITGETGVGKDVCARLVHILSDRKGYTFEYINCASIPRDLLESELFGYRKGAFTGALRDKKGKFEITNNGTLLLNEICDMPIELQAKILDAIEMKEIFPLGSEKAVEINVRIISATNKNIENEVEKGNFREDLYYRLNVLRLHIPPLRERKEDIIPIALYYLRKFCEDNNRPYLELSDSAIVVLEGHNFPGNIRELKNIMEKIVVMKTKGDVVTDVDVRTAMAEISLKKGSICVEELKPLKEAISDFKRAYILRCLEETKGNISLAAQKLGIHRVHLQRILKEIWDVKRSSH